MNTYDGTWNMICIGSGPGPKNVLAEREEDGKRLVVAYATWKHRMRKSVREPLYGVPTQADDHGRWIGMDAIVQVVAVNARTTSKGRTLYDVKGADGSEYTVWDAPLAQQIAAAAPLGPMTIRFDEKRNGQYTNRSVREFAPAGSQLGPDTGPSVGSGGNRGGGRGGMTESDKTRIAKMAAQGAAATLVAALFQSAGPDAYEEMAALHKRLTIDLYKDARSHEKKDEPVNLIDQATNMIQPTATTPVEVANLVGAGVQVGTAGIAAQQDAAAEAPQDVDWS